MVLIQINNSLCPAVGLPMFDAEPPGGRACGAIAGQLTQAAGKFVKATHWLFRLLLGPYHRAPINFTGPGQSDLAVGKRLRDFIIRKKLPRSVASREIDLQFDP